MDKNIDAESDKLIAEEVVAPREESYYKGNQLKNGASPYSAYIGKNKYDKSIDNYILIKNGSKSDVVVLSKQELILRFAIYLKEFTK